MKKLSYYNNKKKGCLTLLPAKLCLNRNEIWIKFHYLLAVRIRKLVSMESFVRVMEQVDVNTNGEMARDITLPFDSKNHFNLINVQTYLPVSNHQSHITYYICCTNNTFYQAN